VDYDDGDYVTGNVHVQSGLGWESSAWAFKTGHASNWHPLTWLSHELDCQLFGLRAGGHHLTSVFFHIANSVLLLLVLLRMTGALWRSAVVAGLFALHPLHVESVAWVSERKDVLSTFFCLLSVGAYVAYAERAGVKASSGDALAWRRRAAYWAAWLCFALGLMSKPMLVTLPFVLVLLDYWPLGRVEAALAPPRRFARLLPLLVEKVPFLILSAVSSVVTVVVQRHGGAVSSLSILPLGARAENAAVSVARYIGKTLWPAKLSVLYPHPGHWPVWSVVGSLLLLAGISAGVAVLGRRRPYLPVGWLWFLGTLVPVIGLVQVGVQSMADRYMYLPSIGLFILEVWGVGDVLIKEERLGGKAVRSEEERRFSKAFTGWGPVVAGALLIGCCLASAHQITYWRDSEALFRHATEVTQGNYLAYNNLGFYLSNHGKAAEAMSEYQKSLDINPAYADALNNMGYALAGQKKYAEAIGYYERALRLQPENAEVHNNLGNALGSVGKSEEALQEYRTALRLNPEHADAHNNLGVALAMQGKLAEAVDQFHEAIRFKRDYASAHSNLGNAFAVQHRLDEAIAQYQEALRLSPSDAQTQNNLGNALAEQGKVPDAVSHYERAIQLNADNPEAHFNLGMALLRLGQRTDAAAHFAEALRLKPDYAQARMQLEAVRH